MQDFTAFAQMTPSGPTRYWRGNRVWPAPLANSVLYFPGYPGRGSTIQDFSGQGNHGAITGATWEKRLSRLWGLKFNGSTSKVVIPHSASISFAADLYFKYWLIPTSAFTGDRWVFAKGTSYRLLAHNNIAYWLFYLNSMINYVQLFGSHRSLTIGQPYQFICSWDNATQVPTCRVNGEVSGISLDNPGAIDTNTSDFVISGDNNGANNNLPADVYLWEMGPNQLTTNEMLNKWQRERHLFGV